MLQKIKTNVNLNLVRDNYTLIPNYRTMKKLELILSLLLILAIVTLVISTKPTEIKQDITSGDVHKAYCENIYFQPNAEEKLEEAHCNIQEVEQEVYNVKKGY